MDNLAPPLQPIEEEAVEIRCDPGMSWPPELEGDTGLTPTWTRNLFDLAATTFHKYRAHRQLNAENNHLTPQGALAADAEWASARISQLMKEREKLAASTKTLEENVERLMQEGIGALPEHPADIALLQEIRTWLRGLPEAERTFKVEELVRKGDTTALRAVLTAPGYLTGVNEAMLAEIRDEVARKANPEKWAKVDAVRKGYTAADRALEGVIRYLTHDTSPEALRTRAVRPIT